MAQNMNPYTQGPCPGFDPYRCGAPNIGAAPLRAPMNPMPAPNVDRPVMPQPTYPFATTQQNQYAGGQNPSFVAENQYYFNNQAPFVRPYFIDPQNIFQVRTGAQFAPGTRVGLIQFIEPTGHEWFSNANDFEIVSNSLINGNENETLMLQRRRQLPQGNMPFRHNFMADNPPVAHNPTVHLNQPLQNDSMHASYAQASNLSVSETLSPPSADLQIDEPMVANNEVVVTSTNSTKTDQVISQMTLPLGFCGQVQPMEADVPFELQMQSKLSDFCWTCHKLVAEEDKVSRRCNCGLVFHEQCQPDTLLPTVSGLLPNGEYKKITLDRNQMIGKCKECVHKEVGSLYNREFGMNENEANIVFIYAATKLAEDKELVCFKKLPIIGTLDKLMDLDTIMDNALQNGYYHSIERFMFDIKLIIHHARIINENHNGTFTEEKLAELLKSAKVETNYISMCPDCYRNFYESTLEQTTDNADDIPCINPHGIVWAKKDKHWLPAKVYDYRVADHFYTSQDLVSVIFFGIDQKEPIQVNANECLMYSNKYPRKRSGLKKPANLKDAKRVANQYVNNLGLFFTHEYQVPEDETGFDWKKIFIDINEPKDREEALKNITKRELPTRH